MLIRESSSLDDALQVWSRRFPFYFLCWFNCDLTSHTGNLLICTIFLLHHLSLDVSKTTHFMQNTIRHNGFIISNVMMNQLKNQYHLYKTKLLIISLIGCLEKEMNGHAEHSKMFRHICTL